MIYPAEFEQKTGFDQIRLLLKERCLSVSGKKYVDAIAFSSDHATILRHLRLTEELRLILISEESFPATGFPDLLDMLNYLRIENTYAEPEELAELRTLITLFLEMSRFFSKERIKLYPLLATMIREVSAADEEDSVVSVKQISGIPTRIDRILDDRNGGLRDNASPELHKIRSSRKEVQGRIEKRMQQILYTAKQNGWTDNETGLTMREGRLVIPVKSAHKRKLRGFICDESATGLTVYIEPAELLELHNVIRELTSAEKREIIRILTAVANEIRPHAGILMRISDLLGKLDCVRAKALFAVDTGAMLSKRILQDPLINWQQAVHPLLLLSHRKAGKKVVPLSITLHPAHRIIVISGPNAGGKSICLKTVGLLQYMLQCGLLPPARDDSEFGIFREIMIDIGDEQSLENDLSTYTSKLLSMKYFIEHLQESSLFLIDELGTGTDPSVGGAIAEAALLTMAEKGASGVVTTHYANLKLLAGTPKSPCLKLDRPEEDLPSHYEGRIGVGSSGICNGAMLFDSQTMKPLYQLQIGYPGSSFALEIAGEIGFPETVLKRASELVGGSQLGFDRQLQDLGVEQEEIRKRTTEVQVADDFLNELIGKYQKLVTELEQKRTEILEKARQEAHGLLKDSNKLIEHVIKEIRESQADKERTKNAREKIRQKKDQLETCVQCSSKEPKKHEVTTGGKTSTKGSTVYHAIIKEKLDSFTMTLDLRGKRVDEAFPELQQYIDDAILLSVKEVRILHGKGTGTLREITREYLRSVKEVKSFQDEHVERGGAGITVVTF